MWHKRFDWFTLFYFINQIIHKSAQIHFRITILNVHIQMYKCTCTCTNMYCMYVYNNNYVNILFCVPILTYTYTFSTYTFSLSGSVWVNDRSPWNGDHTLSHPLTIVNYGRGQGLPSETQTNWKSRPQSIIQVGIEYIFARTTCICNVVAQQKWES